MKKCFRKKTLWKFLKCLWKTFRVFLISIFYSLFFHKIKNFFSTYQVCWKKKVWVGISGGVDSSVSALMLKKQAYEVIGVFIKVYQPEVVTFCWRNEMLDAKNICKQLKIPFIFLNLEKEYKESIFDYMVNSYKKGETPNPDVFCNKFIKFGAFLKKAVENGVDFVAMGHYARVKFNRKNNVFELLKGLDKNKDQSYFLSSISQYQLSKALFPIGELEKKDVRKIAEENNLFTAKKKDSQGLCFVGKVNMREFLQNFVPKKEGKILNLEGKEIGKHDGAIFYTIGERHGFEIFPKFRTPDTPRNFVLKKDIKENTIIIGEKNIEAENILNKRKVEIKNLNWISGSEPDFSKKYSAMIRYRGRNIEAKLEKIPSDELYPYSVEHGYKDGIKILVSFVEPQNSVAKGQILVIYDGDICLGEGEII